MNIPQSNEVLDVAVIGGGLCGTYISHRLHKLYPNLKLKIFERSRHVGGRLRSIEEHANDSEVRPQELGGMRVFQDVHKLMTALISEMGESTYPYKLQVDKNFFYDGKTQAYTFKPGKMGIDYDEEGVVKKVEKEAPADIMGIKPGAKILKFALDGAVEQAYSQVGLANAENGTSGYTVTFLVRSGVKTSPPKKQDLLSIFVKKFRDAHPGDENKPVSEQALNSLSVGDLFGMYGSTEDLQQWQANLGYDDMWGVSAAVFVHENELLSHEDVMQMSTRGWQSLVQSLAKGSDVCLGEKLESLEFSEQTSHVALRFVNGSIVWARSVFITVPSLQLQNIKGIPPSVVDTAENSLISVPAAKIFLSWKSPWWVTDFQLTAGRSITTLRYCRMIYYWDKTTLLIYVAGSNGGADNLERLHKQGGIQAVVKAVVDELSLAHYGKIGQVPPPEERHYHNWPFAISLWKKGVDIPAVQKELLQPLGPNIPIWCASSCVSKTQQGWMEGALESSNSALKSFNARNILMKSVADVGESDQSKLRAQCTEPDVHGMRCDRGHPLHQARLHLLQGFIHTRICRLCNKIIARKETWWRCEDRECRLSVCAVGRLRDAYCICGACARRGDICHPAN